MIVSQKVGKVLIFILMPGLLVGYLFCIGKNGNFEILEKFRDLFKRSNYYMEYKMSWDYRITKKKFNHLDGEVEEQFTIREIYYDCDDKIILYSKEPMYVCGETLEELEKDFELYKKAFGQPIIDLDELEK